MTKLTSEYCLAVRRKLGLNASRDLVSGRVPEIRDFAFYQAMNKRTIAK
jgi:hypothetical protein